MLRWLQSLLNFFGGGLNYIWNSVINILVALYNDLTSNTNTVYAYAQAVYAALRALAREYADFIANNYTPFVKWTWDGFNIVDQKMYALFLQIQKYATQAHKQDQQQIQVVQENLNSGLAGIIAWVLSHIFGPLSSEIGELFAWIARWGTWLVDLLTNLEKLADLLMAFLWTGWLVLFRKYAKQIVLFIFHNWHNWLPEVLSVVEDIISSIVLDGKWRHGGQQQAWGKPRHADSAYRSPCHNPCAHELGWCKAQASHDDISCYIG